MLTDEELRAKALQILPHISASVGGVNVEAAAVRALINLTCAGRVVPLLAPYVRAVEWAIAERERLAAPSPLAVALAETFTDDELFDIGHDLTFGPGSNATDRLLAAIEEARKD